MRQYGLLPPAGLYLQAVSNSVVPQLGDSARGEYGDEVDRMCELSLHLGFQPEAYLE